MHLEKSQDKEGLLSNWTAVEHAASFNASGRQSRVSPIALFILGLASIALLLSRLGPWFLRLDADHEIRHGSRITQLMTLSPSLIPSESNGRRLVIVGDVHGCLDSLEQLLDKVDFHYDKDHLVLAGDMINKGPKSHQTIKFVRRLGASCVRGNHEDKTLRNRIPRKLAESTPTDRRGSELSDKDLDWLEGCPLILELGRLPSVSEASTVAVVHAGLVPGMRLSKQDPFAVMHMRSISKVSKKFVPSEDRDDGEPWYTVWNREQELLSSRRNGKLLTTMAIYGHDSRTGLNPRKWSLGLDSGCVGGGQLSAVVIDWEKARVESVECHNQRRRALL